MKPCRVHLIGAGPGDPGLITVKGRERLTQADVVVYDRLIGGEILSWCRPDAEMIYVGKGPDRHTMTQEEINATLVAKAREGKRVARLKGGDPFVFGRGGEEALELVKHGIDFEVIPGVTSAIAAAAYAGIPVTERAVATSFCVVTGHETPDKDAPQADWERLATGPDTLVILMGVAHLPETVERLIAHGRPLDTPVACVRWGTTARQETVVGTLGDIVQRIAEAGLQPPVATIVGEVVRLRERLRWFDNRPLFGKRILVTRTREQAGELGALLRDHGAEVIETPVIRIVPPEDFGPLDRALARAAEYDWLIFTSVNGVRAVRDRLWETGLDIRALHGPRIAAIGPRTAEECQAVGLRPSVVPAEYVAENLAATLGAEGVSGQRILIARAAEAREVLPDTLINLGTQVEVVPAYQTVPDTDGLARLADALDAGDIDIITFASSSTVRFFVEALGQDRAQALTSHAKIACIGPITAQTAKALGLRVDMIPSEYTIPALVEAIIDRAQSTSA
jgi:uroporphyrinogen III methyltransferase/synthase